MAKIRSKILFKVDLINYPNAQIPKVSRKGDVGYDIFSAVNDRIAPGETKIIKTGVFLASMPATIEHESVFLKIEGRSGMASKGIFPVGGIIDPNYRGEIGVILHNSSKEDYVIESGDRIAQLLIYSIFTERDVIFVETNNITKTNRSSNGFGSSGK